MRTNRRRTSTPRLRADQTQATAPSRTGSRRTCSRTVEGYIYQLIRRDGAQIRPTEHERLYGKKLKSDRLLTQEFLFPDPLVFVLPQSGNP